MKKWGIVTKLIGVTIFFPVIESYCIADSIVGTVKPIAAEVKLVQLTDWGDTIRVSLNYLPPKVSLLKVKHGAADLIDCNDHAGYKIPFWPNILLSKDQLPVTLCVVAYDQADNSSMPWEFALK
ncbi:hypothetical protein H0A36_23985 [Endozoicomonas sp. SM1973]|uniref:Uncharacterized protein n=1 Tax=Spartinivicinus marinus TaxID=2994442 RepID=A0A853IGE7_9GAMM|nr:hypothetical protein [Spartinivicinus marinus]MCX4028671.1 hypothetical protein [Spartinivicinus marinus]NYZ69084.1 hypothetical protein [Spartinivicinus marinus]